MRRRDVIKLIAGTAVAWPAGGAGAAVGDTGDWFHGMVARQRRWCAS
jgi:hypothetical protein